DDCVDCESGPSDDCARVDRRVDPRNFISADSQSFCDGGLTAERTDSSMSNIWDFMELTNPRITFLALITTLVGFYMGSRDRLNFVLLSHAILGTGLVASGASARNQYLERPLDARRMRTRTRRPPTGRAAPSGALHCSSA